MALLLARIHVVRVLGVLLFAGIEVVASRNGRVADEENVFIDQVDDIMCGPIR